MLPMGRTFARVSVSPHMLTENTRPIALLLAGQLSFLQDDQAVLPGDLQAAPGQ